MHWTAQNINIAQTIFSYLISDFVIPQIKPVIWDSIPAEMKHVDLLETFKSKIRMWKPNNYPCRICKNYIPNVGFLQTFSIKF